MDGIQITGVDWSIMHQLQLNARQTDMEIAKKVNVTSTMVRNRLDKLEDARGSGFVFGDLPTVSLHIR